MPDYLTYECEEDGTCYCPCTPDSSSSVCTLFVDAASSKQCEMISKVCRVGGMRGGERGEAGEEVEEETFLS